MNVYLEQNRLTEYKKKLKLETLFIIQKGGETCCTDKLKSNLQKIYAPFEN